MTATMAVSVAPGEQTTMPRRSLNQLQETAWRLSRHILEMTTIAGSGHPSSSLSAIDIMTGLMVAAALEAAQTLSGRGINARVIDMHTLKPLDAATIVRAAQETGALVTAEEHLLEGGLGSAVARVVTEQHPAPMAFVALRNTYAESGKGGELLEKYGLTAAEIVVAVDQVLARKQALRQR